MKKFFCLILALICLAPAAFADTAATDELDVPSKDTGAMASVEIEDEEDAGLVMKIGSDEKDEEIPEKIAKILADEIAKLANSKTISAYFDGALTYGVTLEPVTLKEVLGEEPAKILEFSTLYVDKYEKDVMGSVTVTLKFATPYEKDEKVAVLIGFFDTEDLSVEWFVFEGVGTGEDGGVRVEFTEEAMERIQNTPDNYVLLAVASL